MNQTIKSLILSLVACLAACGGTTTPPENTTPAQPSATSDMESACRDSFAKERTCTDNYIPALVDTRIELDLPAGIAAEAKQNGRETLITQAKTEWAKDSEPAAVANQCKAMAAEMPAEQKTELTTALSQCPTSSDCDAYVKCIMPITRKMLAARK